MSLPCPPEGVTCSGVPEPSAFITKMLPPVEKAILSPSGDHEGSLAPVANEAVRFVEPPVPSAFIT